MYKIVKTLAGLDKVSNKNGGIKDEDEQGELMSEPDEIKKRWKCNKGGKPSEMDFQLEEESAVESDALGPDLMESEIINSSKR